MSEKLEEVSVQMSVVWLQSSLTTFAMDKHGDVSSGTSNVLQAMVQCTLQCGR